MLKTETKISQILTQAEISQRVRAFVVTSSAVFVLACLVWPLTVTSFRSVATINVISATSDDARTRFQQNVSQLVSEETTDERIEAIVAQLEATGKLQSKEIEFRDHDSIRSALMVGINNQPDGFEFLLGYDGGGSLDERELVNLLAARIAHRLRPDPNSMAGQQLLTEFSMNDVNSINSYKDMQNRKIDEATWIVDQIENDLKSVQYSLAQIGNTSNAYGSTEEPLPPGDSPFQYASSKKPVADTTNLTQAIDSIDIPSLRSILTNIRQQIDTQSNLLSQEFQSESGQRVVVSKLRTSQTLPINGIPSKSGLFFVSLISLLIGATVAVKLDPFAVRGFDNANSIESQLGVPVVAQLRSSPKASAEKQSKSRTPWANRVAKAASLCLFGTFVIVAGFILTNSEVRQMFLENPLFGCAKIIRIFTGY